MLGVCPVKRRERPDGKATQLGGRWETPPEVGGRLGFVETERGRWRVARSVLLDVSTRAAGIAGGIGENQRPPRNEWVATGRGDVNPDDNHGVRSGEDAPAKRRMERASFRCR